MKRLHRLRGFTLVELSVVLVVIAIITAMGISAGIGAIASANKVATEKKLDVIEDALMTFRKKWNRLPCPGDATILPWAANYGIEAASNNGTCAGGTPAATNFSTTGNTVGVPSGAVPTRTLGLPDEFMYDGWGRKFMYEVTPAMTADNAFAYSQISDSCAIDVYDNSNTLMPISAVYDLVSFGKNGIGAYTEGGTRITTGTVGAAESSQVRGIYATSPVIRLNTFENGKINTNTYYDDIVRFKARYQMMDKTDRMTPAYKGPELSLLIITSGGVQLAYGKKKCGAWKAYTGTVPGNIPWIARYADFTPGNTNFLISLWGSAALDCQLYTITNSGLVAVSGTPMDNCPPSMTTSFMAQGNGLYGVGYGTAPYLRLWKLIGTGDAAHYVEIKRWGGIFSPLLAAAPDKVSISAYGEYIAVSTASTNFKQLYVLRNNKYIGLNPTVQPDYANTTYSNAISPSGRYYASTVVSGGSTVLSVWRIVNGVFTQVGSDVTLAGLTTPTILTFSPDSTYIAVGGATSSSNELYVLYLNPVTETLTTINSYDMSPAPAYADFSTDNNFLGVALATTGVSLKLYRRVGNAFNTTSDPISSTFVFNGSSLGYQVSFSR